MLDFSLNRDIVKVRIPFQRISQHEKFPFQQIVARVAEKRGVSRVAGFGNVFRDRTFMVASFAAWKSRAKFGA